MIRNKWIAEIRRQSNRPFMARETGEWRVFAPRLHDETIIPCNQEACSTCTLYVCGEESDESSKRILARSIGDSRSLGKVEA